MTQMIKAIAHIEEEIIEMNIEGDTCFGEERVLLAEDDNLCELCDWSAQGYTIASLLPAVQFEKIHTGITALIKGFVEKETGKEIPGFTLAKYHEYCSENEVHLRVVSNFQKCLPMIDFPVNFNLLDERVSEICGVPVTSNHPTQEASRQFCIRIVRPQRTTDNNPPHRDVWLDRLRNALNIYLPLAGSNNKSSLPLIPGSHLWKESDIERTASGAKVNGVLFTVPCVIGSKYGLSMIRPQAALNEIMVFSPYLIHGGGCNLNENETRVSVEIRFWRKPRS